MRLRLFVARYGQERSIVQKYFGSLETVAKQLCEHCSCEVETESLSADFINPWIMGFESRGQFQTAYNKRLAIGILWRAAHDAGLAPPVGKIRRVKVPKKIPDALTLEEIGAVLRIAEKLKGCFNRTKISRRVYWKSLYNSYYDTALRISDLRSIERPWIWPGGFISIVQSKVQRSHRVQLRPETIALIDELMAGRTTGLIWDTLNKKNFFRAQRKLFKLASVRGSGKWIRRSSASYVERDQPGMGWRHLGHAAPGLAEKCYIDPRIACPETTLPPPLPPIV